jgi:CRP-like cAMP-binding protein
LDRYYSIFKSLINGTSTISERSYQQIKEITRINKLKKRTQFITVDNSDDQEYLLLEGIVQSHILGENGQDITLKFLTGPAVVTPHVIRTKYGKSMINWSALTDIIIAEIPKDNFGQLIEENNDVRTFANEVLKQELIAKTQKEVDLATKSAEDRLIICREQYPNLENAISHKYIASYLGISPESFSRIRKKMILDSKS